MDPQVIVDRLVRLVRLDTTVFEEARDDLAGTIPALVIAVISFFLCGLGGWFWWLTQGYGDKAKVFWQSALLGSLVRVRLLGRLGSCRVRGPRVRLPVYGEC